MVGIDPKNGIQNFGMSKIHLRGSLYTKNPLKYIGMTNNTIPLLYIAKVQIFHPVLLILKISKFSTISSAASLPALFHLQPAIALVLPGLMIW